MKNKIIVLVIMILIICGCDNRKCIKSHEVQDTCMYYYRVGKRIMIPHYYTCTHTVCDEYEEVAENEK